MKQRKKRSGQVTCSIRKGGESKKKGRGLGDEAVGEKKRKKFGGGGGSFCWRFPSREKFKAATLASA